mmetsp:Transcript_12763/g.29407  ORF Transcript_12763/g.29407 Transcript_12763/m.29407 type:complete len:227 (-) Transcript_12763:1398-2078(-)
MIALPTSSATRSCGFSPLMSWCCVFRALTHLSTAVRGGRIGSRRGARHLNRGAWQSNGSTTRTVSACRSRGERSTGERGAPVLRRAECGSRLARVLGPVVLARQSGLGAVGVLQAHHLAHPLGPSFAEYQTGAELQELWAVHELEGDHAAVARPQDLALHFHQLCGLAHGDTVHNRLVVNADRRRVVQHQNFGVEAQACLGVAGRVSEDHALTKLFSLDFLESECA